MCWNVDANPGLQQRDGETPVTGADGIRPSAGGGVGCMGCPRADVLRMWLGCLEGFGQFWSAGSGNCPLGMGK